MHQLPLRFRRQNSGNETLISWAWRTSWIVPIFLSVWLIFWWSFIYRTEGRKITIQAKNDPELTLTDILLTKLASIEWWSSLFPFPLLQILAGIAMIYVLLLQLFNRTTVSIGAREITLTHRPFPWIHPKALKLSDVESFLADSVTTKRHEKKSKTRHAAVAKLYNNQRIRIVSLEHGQAKHEIEYLVQELNSRI